MIKNIRSSKGQLQISFPWLFAIIVGVFILFLAIFASTKIINNQQTTLDAETAKKIGILLDPLETGFESSISTSMILPSETRIYNKCDVNGNFGDQIIQVSQKTYGKWTETNVDVSFKNKYIFSDSQVEGKEFYLFSKQFNFPFKIADTIILTSSSQNYCFVDAPREIEREIKNFQNNFQISNCSSEAIKICFNKKCDITVSYNNGEGYVDKNGKKSYFVGDLIYGAIFSSPEIYECQVKRLMKRTDLLSSIYQEKSLTISSKCDSSASENLLLLNNAVRSLRNSQDLYAINTISTRVEDQNNGALCKIF